MTFNIDYYERGREQQVLWEADSKEAARFSFERCHPFADILWIDRIRENWESGAPALDRPSRESA